MSELTPAQLERLAQLFEAFSKSGDDSEANEIFMLLDRNGNGKIEAAELKTVFSQMSGKEVSDEQVATYISDDDTNLDGVIQLREFIEGLKKRLR